MAMKKWLMYSAAPLLSVTLLAACGGSDGDDGSSSESVDGETTSETIGSGDIELVFFGSLEILATIN